MHRFNNEQRKENNKMKLLITLIMFTSLNAHSSIYKALDRVCPLGSDCGDQRNTAQGKVTEYEYVDGNRTKQCRQVESCSPLAGCKTIVTCE